MTAIALTIAGSDSSGGAGIQADLKTFAALRVYGASVITALTAQNTRGVEAVHVVPPDFVLAQMGAIARDLDVGAIKIGMLANKMVIDAVAEGLKLLPGVPVVLDPVMVAQSGDVLLEEEAIDTLRSVLMPQATVVTPNLSEAARLLDAHEAGSFEEMKAQARRLHEMCGAAILVKGGHAEGEEAPDAYFDDRGEVEFRGARLATANTHGTGCTLSAAIAAELAKKTALRGAVAHGKIFVAGAIEHADDLKVGRGSGPVHHMHLLWTKVWP
ncbi:MAG: bifunctional hydroxymethylpyrimidine kinase/phosphomethylpyrimidine kinase [Methyloceanibacter sp.]